MKENIEPQESSFSVMTGPARDIALIKNQMLSSYSIVVPARNEEETIGDVLENVRHMTDDLIVVDGHSSDDTVRIARSYGARVVQDNGRGKGDAVRIGLANVAYPITVFIDADGSHDPETSRSSWRRLLPVRPTLFWVPGCSAGVRNCSGPFRKCFA